MTLKSAAENCRGDYMNTAKANSLCLHSLQRYEERLQFSAAGFFGYMLVLLQRRVGSMISIEPDKTSASYDSALFYSVVSTYLLVYNYGMYFLSMPRPCLSTLALQKIEVVSDCATCIA
ncbi:hypothetical protein Tco_1298307 [Tanacetum coccineum]